MKKVFMARAAISGSRILKAMIVNGAASRADLCKVLGLSKAAVTVGVDKLLDRKLVFEGSTLTENRVGRKRTQLNVRPEIAYFIGTDLEGLAVRVCVIDAAGKRVYNAKKNIAADWSTAVIYKHWSKLISDAISKSNVPFDKIAGMGVGLPGAVNRGTLSTRAYLPPGQWVDFNISNFKSLFGLDIVAANNIVCISEFERKKGKAVGLNDFISVLSRYGIGACVYSNGSLTIGQELAIVEFGHMRIDLNGPACICGQKGCLDVFASGRTLARDVNSGKQMNTGKLEQRARYIGIALANMLKLFHTPSVIINGIYNEYEEIIRPVLEQTLKEQLQELLIPIPNILFGDAVELKTCTGAAIKASEELIESFLKRKYFQ